MKLTITSVFFLSLSTLAQLPAQDYRDTIALYLDFPLVDIPYQSHAARTTGNALSGYANPSMQQSLHMSNSFYASAHYGIKKLINTKSEFLQILFTNSIAAGFVVFSTYLPFGNGWLHEEYHRAVLTRRQINSFNDMNTFPFGAITVSVRKVKDEDLIRLSDHHTADFIRSMAAGIEGEYHQTQTLQKHNFFYNQELPHIPLYWLSAMTNILYVNQSGRGVFFDELIEETTAKEGTDISQRDFTGPDFTAWVDALFHPQKAYEERGIHPSGIGINRYIKPSELSDDARTYLQKQGNLQWLNILSPHLFGFPKIKLPIKGEKDYYGSFAVRHVLTSFGNDISLDVFLQSPSSNLMLTIHNYNNLNHSFWGLEGAIIDKSFWGGRLLFSGRTIIWAQPEEHSFMTSKGRLGGLLGLRAAYQCGTLFPYTEIEAKSAGWVMGNESLERNISLNVGLSMRINQ
ncbi:MAG: hypothetical protein AAF587_07160 [Bacteroidota bacterium]